MKTFYVKDLQKGMILDKETFAISEFNKAQDKTGKDYANVVLADKTGRIPAKIWADKLIQLDQSSLTPGAIVIISAKVEEFRGNMQLNILDLSKADETKLDDYMESSEFDPEEMYKELMSYVDAVKHPGLNSILKEMFSDKEFVNNYKYRPAAKSVHHDFRSGLIHHVLEMLTIAKSMQRFYPTANYDILYTGIILHDIGKFEEMSVNGLGTEYTKKGTLVGHISLGSLTFTKFAQGKITEDLYLHVLHLILSHHGEIQYGSPVVPSTLEAVILSYADRLSDKARTAVKALRDISSGKEFGNYNIFMENARFWRGGDYYGEGSDQSAPSVNESGDQLIFATDNEK